MGGLAESVAASSLNDGPQAEARAFAVEGPDTLKEKLQDDGGFAIFVVIGSGSCGAEAELLVDGDHSGIAFATVGYDTAEFVLPGVFDLPGFNAMAQALSSILGQESGALNVKSAVLRRVLRVLAKIFLKVGVMDEGRAAGNLGIDQDPIGFQKQPESLVESVFPENRNIQDPEGGGLLWERCFSKFEGHGGSISLEVSDSLGDALRRKCRLHEGWEPLRCSL